MRIDLNVHASDRSPCATDNEESQIRAAVAAGLDGLAFTDHFRLVPEARLASLRRSHASFRIFSGIEITADREDWLVLGLRDPCLEGREWTYPSLWGFVREQGGYIALAHPSRWATVIHVDLALNPPGAIEVRSNNTPRQREDEIRALAEQHNLALLTNSDAHSNRMPSGYWNDVPGAPDDDRHLLEALRQLTSAAEQPLAAD